MQQNFLLKKVFNKELEEVLKKGPVCYVTVTNEKQGKKAADITFLAQLSGLDITGLFRNLLFSVEFHAKYAN